MGGGDEGVECSSSILRPSGLQSSQKFVSPEPKILNSWSWKWWCWSKVCECVCVCVAYVCICIIYMLWIAYILYIYIYTSCFCGGLPWWPATVHTYGSLPSIPAFPGRALLQDFLEAITCSPFTMGERTQEGKGVGGIRNRLMLMKSNVYCHWLATFWSCVKLWKWWIDEELPATNQKCSVRLFCVWCRIWQSTNCPFLWSWFGFGKLL